MGEDLGVASKVAPNDCGFGRNECPLVWSYDRNGHGEPNEIIQHWMLGESLAVFMLERANWETSVEPPPVGDGDHPFDLRRDPPDSYPKSLTTRKALRFGCKAMFKIDVRTTRVCCVFGNCGSGATEVGQKPTAEEKFAFLKMEAR